jgi:hypothetical protein
MPQGNRICRDEFIIKCCHPMNRVEIILNVSKQDTSLQGATSTLSISRVGQGNKDVRLVHESTRSYGKALKQLQLTLFDPKRIHYAEIHFFYQ